MSRQRAKPDDGRADFLAEVYAVVRRIPRGSVATYGQIAELAGYPRHSRAVGHAMRSVEKKHRVPWQRVVGRAGRARAELAMTTRAARLRQKKMLEAEGVRFVGEDRISLSDFGWLPTDV